MAAELLFIAILCINFLQSSDSHMIFCHRRKSLIFSTPDIFPIYSLLITFFEVLPHNRHNILISDAYIFLFFHLLLHNI